MVRSLSYLENGPLKNMRILGWFLMPYFKPTIDFNKLKYIISSDPHVTKSTTGYRQLLYFGNPAAGFLVNLDNLTILERSKNFYACHFPINHNKFNSQ